MSAEEMERNSRGRRKEDRGGGREEGGERGQAEESQQGAGVEVIMRH